MKKLTSLPPPPPAPEKSHPPLSQRIPSQNWDPVKPLLFENLVGGSNPPAERGVGGVHTMWMVGFLENIFKND